MNRSMWMSVTTGVRLVFAIFIVVMFLITMLGFDNEADLGAEQQIPDSEIMVMK